MASADEHGQHTSMRITTCRRCGRSKPLDVRCDCQPASPTRGRETRTRSAHERGYDATWEAYSRLYRAQHPYCIACEAAGFVTPSCVVDHIVPFRNGQEINEQLRTDPINHQPLCDWRYRDCHNKLKRPIEIQYAGQPDRIRIAWARLLEELRLTRSSNAVGS